MFGTLEFWGAQAIFFVDLKVAGIRGKLEGTVPSSPGSPTVWFRRHSAKLSIIPASRPTTRPSGLPASLAAACKLAAS